MYFITKKKLYTLNFFFNLIYLNNKIVKYLNKLDFLLYSMFLYYNQLFYLIFIKKKNKIQIVSINIKYFNIHNLVNILNFLFHLIFIKHKKI